MSAVLRTPSPATRPRWWQWPTILSLDAPAIVLVWQALIARATGATVAWPHALVLGTSVWLAYAIDRWIEGWRLEGRVVHTPRHRFHQRYRWPLAVVGLFVFAIDLAVAFATLAAWQIATGFLLTTAVAAYLFSHQWLHRHAPWRVPKELCIAALLTGGVALFLFPATAPGPALWMLPMFALLCVANTALISLWEREIDLAHGQTSLALQSTRAPRAIRRLPSIAAAAAVVILIAGPAGTGSAAACAGASAVLLALTDGAATRTGWAAARVLADLSLMTPLLPLLVA